MAVHDAADVRSVLEQRFEVDIGALLSGRREWSPAHLCFVYCHLQSDGQLCPSWEREVLLLLLLLKVGATAIIPQQEDIPLGQKHLYL